MYYKIIVNSLLIISIFIIQLGFVSGLPGWLKFLNIILISIIYLMILVGFEIAFIWAVALGFLLDIYSFTFFGLNIFAFAASLIITSFLLHNFFTDRSLYTYVVLVVVGNLCYKIIIYSFESLHSYILTRTSLDIASMDFWSREIKGMLINIIGAGLAFYTLLFISKTLRPAFLIRKQKI